MNNTKGLTNLRKTLQFKLFLMIVSFSFSIFLVVLVVLFSTQTIDLKSKSLSAGLNNDLSNVENTLRSDMEYYSIKSLNLSEDIETKIEKYFADQGTDPGELPSSGADAEAILTELFDTLNLNLELSTASGTFVVLNTSVNYEASADDRYRAGMCLSSIASGNNSLLNSDIRYLVGPTRIAQENGLTILPQWELEFDISNGTFYNTPHQMYDETQKKDYYWSEKIRIPDSSDEFIFCSVPMKSRNNHFLGCAGFMINSNLFKYAYATPNDEIQDTFLCLSPYKDNIVQTANGMNAANYSVLSKIPGNLAYVDKYNGFEEYACDDERFLGVSSDFAFYNENSIYQGNQWKLLLASHKSNVTSIIERQDVILTFTIIPILMIFIATSYFLSKKYLKPVKKALVLIKTDSNLIKDKTNILEIDDLMEFLVEKDRQREVVNQKSNTAPSKMVAQFIKDIASLSKAEKAVFDLYVQGHTAKEIEKILFLSSNTIKTHNKRIYMKLGVSSYKELRVYLQIMEENKTTKPQE